MAAKDVKMKNEPDIEVAAMLEGLSYFYHLDVVLHAARLAVL